MPTAQQYKLLSFIRERIMATGISPSYQEMMEFMGMKSKSEVHRVIIALQDHGFITKAPKRARTVEVVRMPQDPIEGE